MIVEQALPSYNKAMRIAVFADIHANLEALEAVLDDMKKQKVTSMVCLGDIVGYNADPSACLERVRALGCQAVQGNHDYHSGNDSDLSAMNDVAKTALYWTRGQLSTEQRNYLREMPLTQTVEDFFTVVHASLAEPQRWTYVLSREAAADSFARQDHQVCFCGHTHMPFVFQETDGRVSVAKYKKFQIKSGTRYLINCGSVGQPRDGDPLAAYAIYNVYSNIVELRRVTYDMATAVSKIRAAGLPDALAKRLALGK